MPNNKKMAQMMSLLSLPTTVSSFTAPWPTALKEIVMSHLARYTQLIEQQLPQSLQPENWM